MRFFSFLPKLIVSSTHGRAGRDDTLASMPRKRVPNCDSVSEGVDEDRGIAVDDVDDLDMIVCFLETVEGITRELCNLSLRTRSNEIILD
jgi:hypothetical protein